MEYFGLRMRRRLACATATLVPEPLRELLVLLLAGGALADMGVAASASAAAAAAASAASLCR